MNSNMNRRTAAVAGGNNYDAKSLKDVVRRARTLLVQHLPALQQMPAVRPTTTS